MNWIIVIIALIGVVLNVRRKWQCFLFWGASNLWWLRHNICIDEHAQAVLFGVFFLFCIYGLDEWESRAKARKREIHRQEAIELATALFCKRILGTKSNLADRPGRLNVNWLIDEAKEIVDLLGGEKDKPVDNNSQ